VEVDARVRAVQEFGEQANALGLDLINYYAEATPVPDLVLLNQLVTQVARFVLRTPEGCVAKVYLAAARRR
jgi:hypothetical protein